MKNQIVLIAIVALLLGVIGGYFISKSERYEHGWMMGDWGNSREKEDKNYNKNTNEDTTGMGGMHNMHGSSVTTERKFIEEMIPHHQEAVDTAKQVVARGSNAEAKKLAQEIITAQEKEISDMKTWYKNWYSEDYADKNTYKPMMRDLSTLSGTELDKAFLEDMIVHHMGALMMAQGVTPYTEHTEVRTLIETIAETQSNEVVRMRVLLREI